MSARVEGSQPMARLVQALTTATMHYTERTASIHGLHRSDLQALQVMVQARLAEQPPVTPGRLAASLGLTPSATTSLVDRLERMGHVRRHHDVADRRRVELGLTDLAGTEARAIFGPLARAVETTAGELDTSQLEVVRAFLRAVTARIEAETPEVTGLASR